MVAKNVVANHRRPIGAVDFPAADCMRSAIDPTHENRVPVVNRLIRIVDTTEEPTAIAERLSLQDPESA